MLHHHEVTQALPETVLLSFIRRLCVEPLLLGGAGDLTVNVTSQFSALKKPAIQPVKELLQNGVCELLGVSLRKPEPRVGLRGCDLKQGGQEALTTQPFRP